MSKSPDSHENPANWKGSLLLADPALRDGVFNRSVILLTDHAKDEGAFGLILNKPTGRTVGDFLTTDEFEPIKNLPVHEGGPVSREHLTFSSFWWTPKRGLNWNIRISLDDAIVQAHRPGRIVRAFVGYSGWSAGQLENEWKHHSWIATRPEKDLLGQAHDRALWAQLMRGISPLHRILAESPEDPFLN